MCVYATLFRGGHCFLREAACCPWAAALSPTFAHCLSVSVRTVQQDYVTPLLLLASHAVPGQFYPSHFLPFLSIVVGALHATLQVAAFGAAAGRSLVFSGHLQRVSVAHWPAAVTAAPLPPPQLLLWESHVVPSVMGTMPLRTGREPLCTGTCWFIYCCLVAAHLLRIARRLAPCNCTPGCLTCRRSAHLPLTCLLDKPCVAGPPSCCRSRPPTGWPKITSQ